MCRFCDQEVLGREIPYDPQLGRGGLVPGANMAPDQILYGGTFLTMDRAIPTASAIAVREGVIQAVGTTDEIVDRKGAMTRLTDLNGQVVVPGFIAAGASLPADRGLASLDRWVERFARAGYTTVEIAGAGANFAEFDRLFNVLDRRHRLRLRGIVGVGLKSAWQGGALEPGHGNDLIRLDSVSLPPDASDPDATFAIALSLHAEGWGVVLDCSTGSALSAALRMIESSPDDALAGMRLMMPDAPAAAVAEDLRRAGARLVVAHQGEEPARSLRGSEAQISGTLKSWTVDAARLAGMGSIAGQLRQGFYADFTFLDRLPSCADGDFPNVLGTWIEGVPVRPEAATTIQ